MPLDLVDALGGAVALIAIPAAALGFGGCNGGGTQSAVPAAATVEIAPGSFEYPLPGEFLAASRPGAPMKARIEFDRPIRMMKYAWLSLSLVLLGLGTLSPAVPPSAALHALT